MKLKSTVFALIPVGPMVRFLIGIGATTQLAQSKQINPPHKRVKALLLERL
jgi:hypothetical protein